MTDSSNDKKDIERLKDDDKKAVLTVMEAKEESEKFYDTQFRQFNYFDRLYDQGASKTNVPYGRANLQLPIAFQQVESFVAAMVDAQLDEKPYWTYGARGEEDVDLAESITQYTQYQVDQSDFELEHENLLREMGKKGTSVLKLVWDTETIEIEEEVEKEVPVPITDDQGNLAIDPATGQPQVETTIIKVKEINEEIKFDGVRFINRNIVDFLVPRSATDPDVQKLPWVIDRTYRTLDELLENPNYKNKNKLRQLRDGAEHASPEMKGFKSADVDQTSFGQSREKFEGKLEILEYWGRWKFEGDKNKVPALIVVANTGQDQILLRKEKNPLKYKFKPFIATNYVRKNGSFYGYGILHHIRGLIEESTALRNARLDIANMSLNPMWLADRMSGLNTRELFAVPNKIIFANDINGIKKLEFSGVTVASVQEIARMDFDINNTTDIAAPSQAGTNVGGAFSGTATGVSFVASKSQLRLKLIAKIMERGYFKPLALMMLMYNRDMIEDDEVRFFRVLEDDTNPFQREISGQAFMTPVDFIPAAVPDKFSLGERRDQIAYFMQTLGQLMGVDPTIRINGEEAIKVLGSAAGIPHAERLVTQGPVQVMALPNGQLMDMKGQPVQVTPVDEQGQPVQQEAGQPNVG